jgi:hypothetical protein
MSLYIQPELLAGVLLVSRKEDTSRLIQEGGRRWDFAFSPADRGAGRSGWAFLDLTLTPGKKRFDSPAFCVIIFKTVRVRGPNVPHRVPEPSRSVLYDRGPDPE